MKTNLLFLPFLFITINVFCQKDPMKFGKISKEDLEMTVYEKDTTAIAVVLCEYGYFQSTDFQFIHMVRFKILKKEGLNYANNLMPFTSETSVRGITYNLENGKIVKEKLKYGSIFHEKVTGNIYNVRVAMPNVKVGSVIDIEYRSLGIPFKWNFQRDIPVKWSELVIESSGIFNYRKKYFGLNPLQIHEPSRWVAKDVPPLKKEPFIDCVDNYRSHFEIEITKTFARWHNMALASTWEAINGWLLQTQSHAGGTFNGAIFLNPIVEEIEKESKTDLEKIRRAFEAVKKVKWNKRETQYLSNSNLGKIYKEKIGNSADINTILVQLLRKLGFDAVPVAISTRGNGLLSKDFPTMYKLNYILALVNLNGNEILLDATEEKIPYNTLPKRCLNRKGRSIHSKNSTWVNLTTKKKDKQVVYCDLILNDDYSFEGQISKTKYDYAALDFRNEYDEYNSEDEYLDDFESNNTGLRIKKFKLENLDSIYMPLKEKYEVSFSNHVDVIGNEIYLSPLLFEKMTENPFQLEERRMPVDFAYGRDKTYMLKLKLPTNTTVKEIPAPISMKMPNNAGYFTYRVSVVGEYLNVQYKFGLNKTDYSLLEYPDLREFYNQIILKHAEPIILNTL